jgi:hypothetical protein
MSSQLQEKIKVNRDKPDLAVAGLVRHVEKLLPYPDRCRRGCKFLASVQKLAARGPRSPDFLLLCLLLWESKGGKMKFTFEALSFERLERNNAVDRTRI